MCFECSAAGSSYDRQLGKHTQPCDIPSSNLCDQDISGATPDLQTTHCFLLPLGYCEHSCRICNLKISLHIVQKDIVQR